MFAEQPYASRGFSMSEAVPPPEAYPAPIQPVPEPIPAAPGLDDPHAFVVVPGDETLEEVEMKLILRCLDRFGGNRTKTADALGVSVRTIRNKLGRYRKMGVEVPE